MNTAERDPFAPDTAAQRAILLLAIASGALLLVAHEALENDAAWFASRTLRCLWFTLALAPPLMAALTVQRLGDRRFIGSALAYTALLALMAWHSGAAVQSPQVDVWPVAGPYVWVLLVSGHVASAWVSVWLLRGGFGYPLLFDAAWRHVSSLMQALAYTGAFWLLLMLWAALFKALGIGFFDELFEMRVFIYPVTSLVAGYGLLLARTKSSIGDAVHLRILALWRGLLPLAALLALAFAAALAVQGVQPLWDTRHATQLLLALIVALVALSNAAYGKGGEAPPHRLLRIAVQAALWLLPLFAVLAAWALALRWQQYGLSLDRLWAALSIGVASVYALGYARAATRRSNPWLHGIAPVNRLASALMATALVLTQTPLLDFRAITARALQARGDTLNDDDLRYLRWQLGQPGLTALHTVQQQRQASNPDSAAAIARLLSQTSRWQDHEAADAPPKAPLTYRHPPNHPAVPAGLHAALAAHAVTGWSGDALEPDGAPEYWLFSLALDAHDPPEWLRLTLPLKADGHERVWLEVFRADASGAWRRIRTEDFWRDDIPALRQSLQDGHFAAQPRDLLDVRIGTQTLRFSKPD